MLTCSNRHHGKHLSAGRWSNPTELKVEVGTQLEARDIFMFQSQLLKEDQHPSWKNTRGFVVKRAGANWKLCAPPRHGGWPFLQIPAKANGNKPTPPLDVEWQTTRHTHQICGPYIHPGPCILTEVHSRGIDASTWDWCALAPGHYGQRRCPDCRWKQARE